MPTVESSDAPDVPSRRRAGCRQWFAAILVLSIAFGYFVVWPIAERAVRDAQGAVENVLQGVLEELGAIVTRVYDDARQHVEESPQAREMFGEPVRCPPVEEVTWLAGSSNKQFEFTFAVTGPKGAGNAHATATATETSFEITSLKVTGPEGRMVALLPARQVPDSE